ncbi:NAD(P)-binding protein [Ramicandelaber brevisporus]|nr:NAD(P)-binding protein [Ramicandelaber brevisporus]
MKVEDNVPVPSPSSGQVLVRVQAVGVNFFDKLMVEGKYQVKPPFPFSPGCEYAGIIEKVDHSVAHLFKPGDRVFGSAMHGAYAEYIVADVEQVLKIPENLTFEQAAGMFITFPTSYAALVQRANLQPGETVLVHAGAGGVGLAAVQIAKALGASKVIATCSKSKHGIVLANGADHAIDYSEKDWPQQVLNLTDGRGVDVVYDPIGLLELSTKCVARGARLLVIGFVAGKIEKIAVNRLLLKNISVVGVSGLLYVPNEPGKLNPTWQGIFELVNSGKVKPVVYEKVFYGLESTVPAIDELLARKTYGKIAVVVNKEGSVSKL